MKLKKLPQPSDNVAMLIQLVKLEDESDDDEPFEESTISEGTYAVDSQGRVWKLEDTVTMLFQGLAKK